jgi:hypothetical protein
MNLIKASLFGLALSLALSGVDAKDNKPTGLALQQIQSRDYDANYDTVFPSVITVLQDAGYRIQSADKNSGLITGTASTKSGMRWGLVGGWGKSKKTPVVSAFIEPRGPAMARVRLSFVMAKTKSTMYGMNSSDESPITDPAVYQEAFEKIEQAIFVRTSMDAPTPSH